MKTSKLRRSSTDTETYEIIAAQQLDDAPRLYSEQDLDRLVRTLCARELKLRSLTSEALDAADKRAFLSSSGPNFVSYNGPTPFCLQEHLGDKDKVVVANVKIAGGPQNGPHSVYQLSLHDENRLPGHSCQCCVSGQHQMVPLSKETTTMKQNVQEIVTRLVLHLREHYGVALIAAKFELAQVKSPRSIAKNDLVLIAACAIEITSAASFVSQREDAPNTLDSLIDDAGDARCDEERTTWEFEIPPLASSNFSEKQYRKRHTARDASPLPRVCRQCRGPLDVALSNELKRERATTRSALAKLEASQITIRELGDTSAGMKIEIMHLRRECEDWERRCKALVEQHSLEMDVIRRRLSEANELRKMALEDSSWYGGDANHWQALETRVQRQVSRIVETQLHQQRDAHVEQWRAEWLASVATIQAKAERAKEESDRIERDIEQLARTQTKLELIRAERDELRFQWRFVVRQLTDIKTRGVQLPVRVAGGFSSYPSPSPENVRSVVKWIVDYEVKRVALEARSRTKSAGKRLKLKVELMRALAGQVSSVSPIKKQRSNKSVIARRPSCDSQRGLALALEYSPERSIRLVAGRITSSSPLRHSSRVLVLPPSPSSPFESCHEYPSLSPAYHSPSNTFGSSSNRN